MIGITSEELRAVQHWTGAGVLAIMKRRLVTGGPWLVTDIKRGSSIYELDPCVAEEVETGIETQGSNLSGVSAKIAWVTDHTAPGLDTLTLSVEKLQIAPPKGELLAPEVAGPAMTGQGPTEQVNTLRLNSLHITINLESGALLPLALRGRLKHGRHFTFRVSGALQCLIYSLY